jgi:hypothetical protein
MRNLLTTTLLFFCTFLFAQITKNVGDFTKVTSFDGIAVTLIQANENKVVLSGVGSENVELINKNEQLLIRMPFVKTMKGDNISATVYFKKIDALEANEGSSIQSEHTFKTIIFDIIVKEGAIMNVNLDVTRLAIKITSGANLEVSGNCKNMDVIVNSGGVLDAKNLKAEQVVVTSNTGGEATILATELVDARVRAGGNILIYGKPKQINKKIVLGGSIEEFNQ